MFRSRSLHSGIFQGAAGGIDCLEDQLQEFGRAGRDGKPSVAVMFHNGSSLGRDVSRLRFMAEKAVEAAQVSALDLTQMLEQRYHQIDEVNELMRAQSCIRVAISEYFQGPKSTRRPSLSVRILNWAFGARTKARRFHACCDHCDKAEIGRRDMVGYQRDEQKGDACGCRRVDHQVRFA